MDIKKLTITTLSAMLLAASLPSCGNGEDSENANVSREVYNELLERYEGLQQSIDKTASKNERNRIELNNIMTELNGITGKTIQLQKDVESGVYTDERSTSEIIKESIAAIKERLNKVQKSGNVDAQSKALITQLRQTILLNEQEIERLNAVIAGKDQTIQALDSDLQEKNLRLEKTLALQEKTLALLRKKEIDNWIQTGDAIMSACELLPEVKGHGNMAPVKKATLKMLERAKAAYEEAKSLGSAEVDDKIRIAERKYHETKNR